MRNNYLALVGVVAALSLSSAATGQATLTDPVTKQTTTKSLRKGPAPVRFHQDTPARDASRGGVALNDLCGNAEVLTVNAAGECPAAGVPGNNAAAGFETEPSCDPGASAYEDVWYAFNSGAYTTVVIDLTPGDIGDIVIDVLEGGCAGTSVYCQFGEISNSVSVTPGTDYVFMVSSNNDFGFGGTFDICLSGSGGGAGPANDECDNAIALPVGGACTPVSANAADATQSLDAILCNGFTSPEGNDVWFSFEATGAVTSITVEGVGTFDAVLEGFTGTCGALTSVACADATFPPNSTVETLTMVTTAGETYYVRVYSYWSPVPTDFDFTICAFTPSDVPANDVCTGTTPVDLAIDGSVTFTGDNTGALDTEGLGFASVWHAFTITECANVVLDYCGTTPAFENASLRLYIGCPNTSFVGSSSFDVETCADGNVTIFYNSLAAGTYYYAVLTEPGAQGPYTINVAATACPAGPANDECAGAQSLNVNLTCVPTPGTTADATQSLAPILCNGFTSSNALDVWYSFVATTPEHTITVEGIEEFDGVLEFFSGDCAGLTSVSCTDDNFPNPDPVTEVMVQAGLTVGATYYVRVYDYAHASVNHLFNICVTGDVGTAVDGIAGNSNSFSVFPNPGNGDMTIASGDMSGAVVIELMDMTGRIMHAEQRAMVAGQAQQLQLAGRLAAGSYVLRLSTEQGTSEQRVVIR